MSEAKTIFDSIQKENDDLKIRIAGILEERKRTEEAFRKMIKELKIENARLKEEINKEKRRSHDDCSLYLLF